VAYNKHQWYFFQLKTLDVEPDDERKSLAAQFLTTLGLALLLTMFLSEKSANSLRFNILLAILFWFNNSYFRLIIFALVVPLLELIKKKRGVEKSVKASQYEKMLISSIFYLQAIIMYFTCFGSTDTNVNVRAALRGTTDLIGIDYVRSGIIFAVTKYSIQILVIGFFYLRFIGDDLKEDFFDHGIFSFTYYGYKQFQPYLKNLIVWGLMFFSFELIMSFELDAELKAHV
jgi:hypothetical protein